MGNVRVYSNSQCAMLMPEFSQVREGHVAVSARAMTEDIIHKMFDYNTNDTLFPAVVTGKRRAQPVQPGAKKWRAERPFRLMLNFFYLVSFLCLLRSDEALRIQWEWLTLDEGPDIPGGFRLKLELPFHKTHQTGGVYLIAGL